MDEDYERVLLVKPQVYVYKIPPLLSTSRGFRAADWNLGQPEWSGRLRVISKGDKCFLSIEDATSGELYCRAPVFVFPGPQVQPVSDSRRYFVVRVVSDTGRSAMIGIGFADGADSFDLSVALQDHFSSADKIANEAAESDRPKLDLSLKEGINVKLNIGALGCRLAGKSSESTSAPQQQQQKQSDPSKPFVLPPPPSSTRRRA